MNYTENYHLPQWVKTDRIMMEDFNRMCSDIEAGLTGNAENARDAAAAASNAAEAASNAASNAAAAAAKAQAKADAAYSPDQPPYAVGTYTGTKAAVTVTTGFKPRFVIIAGSTNNGSSDSYTAMVTPGQMAGHVGFTDTGFVAYPLRYSAAPYSTPLYPDLSESGTNYSYIAFR